MNSFRGKLIMRNVVVDELRRKRSKTKIRKNKGGNENRVPKTKRTGNRDTVNERRKKRERRGKEKINATNIAQEMGGYCCFSEGNERRIANTGRYRSCIKEKKNERNT